MLWLSSVSNINDLFLMDFDQHILYKRPYIFFFNCPLQYWICRNVVLLYLGWPGNSISELYYTNLRTGILPVGYRWRSYGKFPLYSCDTKWNTPISRIFSWTFRLTSFFIQITLLLKVKGMLVIITLRHQS